MRREARLAFLVTVAMLAACKRDPGSAGDGAPITNAPAAPPVFGQPTAEQASRKARSEALLAAANVKVSPALPVIAGEALAAMRTKDQVVDRAIALLIVAMKGDGLPQPIVDRVRNDYRADNFFSPEEKVFVAELDPGRQARTDFTWRFECLTCSSGRSASPTSSGRPRVPSTSRPR